MNYIINNAKRNCSIWLPAKDKIFYGMLFLLLFSMGACKKTFLNVVPDNVATIDNAFTSKTEAEKYLMTCYSYMPVDVDPTYNVGITNGDLVWIEDNAINIRNTNVLQMPRGAQNTADPIANLWDGYRDGVMNSSGKGMFRAIRDCNIFIDNVSDQTKIPDLDIDTRIRWIAEAKFLKAYYHFLLFRAYGPIPIIDKNLPIDAPLKETQVKRQPVDSVVNYIADLLDTAAKNLPAMIYSEASELGRITKPIALGLKARLLVTAASPLYNGNTDYAGFTDNDGTHLFNPTFSVEKWQRAADACKAAIDLCTSQGDSLYVFPQQTYALTDTTMTQMSIRNATSEPWNIELIWGLTVNNMDGFNTFFQRMGAAPFDRTFINNGGITYGAAAMGPTLKCAELFYTKNGVPINDDKTLDFSNISALRTATHEERFNIKEGEVTARLNFDREPRFYADLGFDRGIWYMSNSPSKTDENTYYLFCRAGEFGQNSPIPICTYFMKKIVNWKMDWNTGTFPQYPYPEMRLAGLYLLYAEALNEANSTPADDVYKYINLVRARAGLPTVQYSWTHFSKTPTKYTTQSGMREIIQRERSIELCFEGQRYWDLIRWKRAATELTGNVTGWDRSGRTAELFYRELTYYTRHFVAPRDYLFPLMDNDLLNNPNLVQNPGW
ncbi:Starch-binding associating with outer membrane [Arachidicoccus rhizosphaerae]|uniref:Starch-binding associating with outer membrane n=1 Tax=Arachidicoccus rhizosphaerae TaxID=551991 RepID=A0A1H3Y6K1_9BACT|nr:RagB/SusD family nutrient uptake outer membrane protein [Arachidicoccus rhizosphaerae]SEA07245.1 Starch-binding associating with outer membrane [Arachidicoccus rhizosphaerae]